MRTTPFLIALVLAGSLLAGCTEPTPTGTDAPDPEPGAGDAPATDGGIAPEAVQGGPGVGGGQVNDVAPEVQTFTGSLTTADNSGTYAEVFTGTLYDANGELDFRNAVLRVTLAGAATGTYTHTIAAQETQASTDEPAEFGADGFKVWTGTRFDGVLNFKFRYRYALGTAPGVYEFSSALVTPAGDTITGPSETTTVEVFSEITIDPVPVNPNGTPATSSNWGLWTADPGATNVEALNYVKLVNTGQKADAVVVIDFTEDAFRGADDNYSIPISDNVEFAWFEDSTPATTAPDEGTYAWLPANGDGSVTVTFSALQNVIYVKYRVTQLPQILASQAYGATYTATEL